MCEITKKCKACLEEKCVEDFYKDSKKEGGLFIKCKFCVNSQNPIVKDTIIKDGKKKCSKCKEAKTLDSFYPSKKEACGYRSECIQCKLEYAKLYENKSEYRKNYREETKDYTKEYNKRYREENKDKLNEYYSQYWKDNKQRRKDNKIRRIETNPLEGLKLSIGSNIRATFKSRGQCKNKHTADILGCSIKEFMQHIESQFLPWMNWNNQGKNNGNYDEYWQLDHIIPMCYAKDEEEVYLLNHWSNFQPMCAKRNNEKSCSEQYLSNIELKILFNENSIEYFSNPK